MLKDECGNIVENPTEIKKNILDHYKILFTSEDLANPPDILSCESINCSIPPTIFEIKEATFSIGGFKAPGEDGFHGFFYHHLWDSIKLDCFRLVEDIF